MTEGDSGVDVETMATDDDTTLVVEVVESVGEVTEGDTGVDVEKTAVGDSTVVVEVVGSIVEVTGVTVETIAADVVVEVVGSVVEAIEGDTGVDVKTTAVGDSTVVIEVVGKDTPVLVVTPEEDSNVVKALEV